MDCCSTETQAVDVAEALAADPLNAPAPQDDPRHACRDCNGVSRPVTRKTVLLMLKPEMLDRAVEGEYRFCPDSDCRGVYFTEGGGVLFTTADLRVRVGLKERVDPIPLCYCFGFDEQDAREEIERTGTCIIPQRIAALIKEKMCACPAKNPSGACCLGEVNKAIKKLMADTVEVG
jgi:hypothetical protein